MRDTMGGTPLPCGHPETAVVTGGEGTAYCGECAAGGTPSEPQEEQRQEREAGGGRAASVSPEQESASFAGRVYLVCHNCEEGYVVDSVWTSQEAAEAHVKAKRWERDVEMGLTYINEEALGAG